ncbi:MAG: amino acid ABC transporter substrate-binding protein [Proteobacteria bacterium]|nr:amino acid ABC transporter substrate-binding protein [Pseudomonadota bacterium]
MKHELSIRVAVRIVLFLAAFGTGPSPAMAGEIVVGMPCSLSGPYQVLGVRNLQGVRMWAEEVNARGGLQAGSEKRPVKVVWYDDRSDKDTAIHLTERLVTREKADFLMAPYGSSLTLAASVVSERRGRLMLCHSAASDRIWSKGYRFLVGVLTPASLYYQSTLEMLKTLDPPVLTLALISEDEPFNRSIAGGVRQRAADMGFRIVLDETYAAHPKDLKPLLAKVKAAGPDAILAASHFLDGVLLARQAAEMKTGAKFFALGSAPSTLEWWNTATPSVAAGTAAASQWEPLERPDPARIENWYGPRLTGAQLNERWKTRWGGPTDFRGVQAYAAGLVLEWAVERAGAFETAPVRAALDDMDITTVYGRQKIDPATGIQTGHRMLITQWQDGRNVCVWPPEAATGRLVYPRP